MSYLEEISRYLKWGILGSVVGILSGIASTIFLLALQWATKTRTLYPDLMLALPLVGFIIGSMYHRLGGAAVRGNNLVIEEIHRNQQPIPLRMAPMVLAGTVLSHLFGASVGREGTAIQMGSSLADWLRRQIGMEGEDRRLLLMAGISGGFGSVFGTPLAGFVFGLEVHSLGRIRYDGVIPCLTAAVIGDLTGRALGAPHSHYPQMLMQEIDLLLVGKVAVAGIFFGITSLLFIELTHAIKNLLRQRISYAPFQPVIGGLLVIGLTLAIQDRAYQGLSLPLIQAAVNGRNVAVYAFALKLIFTAISLGSGYVGGEVTPLFVIGATLGAALAAMLGVDSAFLASIGFVAVFAGASNTPLACTLMGVELFGGGAAIYLALGCFVAYLASGHRGIYLTQRVHVPKHQRMTLETDESLESIARRRMGG